MVLQGCSPPLPRGPFLSIPFLGTHGWEAREPCDVLTGPHYQLPPPHHPPHAVLDKGTKPTAGVLGGLRPLHTVPVKAASRLTGAFPKPPETRPQSTLCMTGVHSTFSNSHFSQQPFGPKNVSVSAFLPMANTVHFLSPLP